MWLSFLKYKVGWVGVVGTPHLGPQPMLFSGGRGQAAP